MEPSTRFTSLDENTFVLGLNNLNNENETSPLPTRFHFVLDNSGSMGKLTSDAKHCFSELVSRATAPCSLVCFTGQSQLIGQNFKTPEQMRAATIPPQGQTNITAGISCTIDIILDIEHKHGSGQTHHIIVLLSDGQHNKGPSPEAAAPELGRQLQLASPKCQLSLIIVGVSRNSNTNMGMIMKTHLETLSLPSLLPIYFAVTPSDMVLALNQMKDGLESIHGSSVEIQIIFNENEDHDEIKKEVEEVKTSFWENVSNKVSNILSASEQDQVKNGILSQVGEPLKKSIDLWINNNEEVPLICMMEEGGRGKTCPIALSITYKSGNVVELPILTNDDEMFQSNKKKMMKKNSIQKKKTIKQCEGEEWTCSVCTFMNTSKLALTCEMCGTIKTSSTPLINENGEEVKEIEKEVDVIVATSIGMSDSDQEEAEAPLIGPEEKPKLDTNYFNEELATKALECMLEKARIQKVAQQSSASNSINKKITNNKNMMMGLKKLISSFENQMNIKKMKLQKIKSEGGSGGGMFLFDKLNGFDRVKQHKESTRTLIGLKELQNQLAALEAFDSKDSSSQAEFLNGSKSKFAAKALSRNAKRYIGAGSDVDPMTALKEEFLTMESKMKLALRSDMCKRVALATRDTSTLESLNTISSSSSLSSSSSTLFPIIANDENKQKLYDIFMNVEGSKKISKSKLIARELIGKELILKNMTTHSIDFLLLNIEKVMKENDMKKDDVYDENKDELKSEEISKEIIHILDKTNQIDDCVDEYLATHNKSNVSTGNKDRSSYLSLLTQREQLSEWAECASECSTTCTGGAYEALMFLGSLAYPIDMKRRAATQCDPYAMQITRVRTSLIDTASLCMALKSNHELVPPEGGMVLSDALVLIDCDCPQASKLAYRSKLLGEIYTSVVLCRDLNMFTGTSQRIALHAHSFSQLATIKNTNSFDRNSDLQQKYKMDQEKRCDLEAMLKRTYLGKAYQCFNCSFGPIDHIACEDLSYHHGETVTGVTGRSAQINNACPKCQWFSSDLDDWPKWNGIVPEEMFNLSDKEIKELKIKKEKANKIKKSLLAKPSCLKSNIYNGSCEVPSSNKIEVLLRILYSARITMGNDTCKELVSKLSNWEESITPADGIDHPLQLVLAMACICDDDLVKDSLNPPALLLILNEMCSRNARDILNMKANATNTTSTTSSAAAVSGESGENLISISRKFVSQFLGIDAASAPEAKGLEEAEPNLTAVREGCCADFTLTPLTECSQHESVGGGGGGGYGKSENNFFDFETFIMNSTDNLLSILLVIMSLREIILKRGGGWKKLTEDMETGMVAYSDVIEYLSMSTGLLSCGPTALLDAILNLDNENKKKDNENEEDKESVDGVEELKVKIFKASQVQQKLSLTVSSVSSLSSTFKGKVRMLATMTAQAFLHYNSNRRRSMANGGSLLDPLGDIRDGLTLRNLCIDLRMCIYQERVQAKMRQWKSVGSDIVITKARAADMGQYIQFFHGHAHGLDKPTFWGLWSAAKSDGYDGEKVKYFLSRANYAFAAKHKK